MKKFLLLILFTFFFQTLLWADETIRTWTTNDGKKLSAIWDIEKYVGKDGDKEFIYFRSGGESYRTKFEDLVKSDRDYISWKLHTAKGFEKIPEEQLENESGKDSDESKGYALLIGVNEYKKPLPPLKFCEGDMKYLAETFERIGFQKDKIVLMAGTGRNSPTKEHIMEQVEGICGKAEKDDLLIIAFSGHGVTIGGVEYICPEDADLNDRQTLIPTDKIFDILTDSPADHKLMIVDACRNELTIPGKKGLEEYETSQGEAQNKDEHNFALLASCKPNHVSWESDDLKHGVFTHFLVKGLLGEAKDKEGGNVTILGLAHYAYQKTKDFVEKMGMGSEQIPKLKSDTEDFVLAKWDSGNSSSSSSQLPEYKPEHEPGERPEHEPGERPEHEPGERMVKTVDGIEYAFRWCPKGSFTMGSKYHFEWQQVERKSMGKYDEDEHQVKLTEGFWMLETEVTQTMWKHIMGNEPSYFKGPQNPVEQVSWSKCEEFCQKLSAKVGGIVSLPTEAQWEYACRAGSKETYAGNLAAMAWYGEDKRHGSTHQVGLKQPNAWGLYDMHGNVWEWCRDWYAGYRTRNKLNPNGPNNGEYRVNRGGSWASEPGACRSASRDSNIPEDENPSIGFRPVLILNEK